MILDVPGPSKATEDATVEPRHSTSSVDSPPPYIQHVENVMHLKAALKRRRRRRVRFIVVGVFIIYTIVLIAVMAKVGHLGGPIWPSRAFWTDRWPFTATLEKTLVWGAFPSHFGHRPLDSASSETSSHVPACLYPIHQSLRLQL